MAIFKKSTVTQTNIAPTTKGVKVTDFTSGESVKTTTTTSPSGQTTTTRTVRNRGGGSVSPQREGELINATQQLEASGKSVLVPPTSSTPTLTQAQQAEASKQQGFSGTVEVYNQVGKVSNLSQRKYYQNDKEVYVDTKPSYQEGKVTNVTYQRDKAGKLTGIQTTTTSPQVSNEEIRPPTREELLAEGTGGVFFTKKEAEARGIVSVNSIGQPTASQRSINFAESLMGQEPGSSGTVYVGQEQLNIKPVSKISSVLAPVKDAYTKANNFLSSKIPTFEETGAKLTQARNFIVSKTDSPILNSLRKADAQASQQILATSPSNPVNQFLGGVGQGIYTDIQQKPLKNVAIFGTGALLGGGLRVAGLGVKAVGGLKAVEVTEGALGTAGFAFGVSYGVDVGTQIKQAPGAREKGKVVGVSAKDAGLFYGGFKTGQNTYNTIYDIWRTKGMTEVPTIEVVAPEYFKGQNYPSVKSGTRAGTLQKEFFNPALPGEIKGTPRGFTASSEPLAEEATILPGTSEVPGLFSAPKVSPAFLRIAGESSERSIVTGEGLLSGGNPTASRVKFNNLDFTPGVNKNTRLPTGFYNREFFEKVRGTGKTFIPGAKTEKEAITSADTIIKQKAKKYYFNFEGRRVVIPEYDIVGGKPSGSSITTLKDVVAEQSSSRIRPSKYSPFFSSRGISPSSSSIGSSISSFFSSLGSSVSSSLSSTKSISSSKSSSQSSISSSQLSRSSSASSSKSSLFSSSRASSSSSRSGSGSSTGRSYSGSSSLPNFGKLKSYPKKKVQGIPGFSVSVRQKGKFKTVGRDLTLSGAYSVGERITQRGLTQSFKVKGAKGQTVPFKVPKGYYAKNSRKNGIVFIEQPRSKINTASEKGLLSTARMFNSKGGRR